MSKGRRETRPVPHATAARMNPRRGTPVALRVMGSGAEVVVPDGVERFSIGSDAGNHLVVQDQFVSGLHCVLERRAPGQWTLKDRQSKNGTFVDGVRVSESQVGPGSRIVVGGTSLALVGRQGGGAGGGAGEAGGV
jgi:pSer/pThr/pTyr-binding forkhead associated (FHA) protein